MKGFVRIRFAALAVAAVLLICLFPGMTDTYAEVSAVLTEKLPQSVNDLDGWSFTMDRGGRYVTSGVLYNGDPFRLGKTNNAGNAAVWQFEDAGEGFGYKFYHISTTVNGEKRYLHFGPKFWENPITTAHATLETSASAQGCPQDIAVVRNNDGTYTFFIAFPQYNYTRIYLNEWYGSGGNGFAGYAYENNDAHFNVTFRTSQPTTENGRNYAVIVRDEDNDKYYAVQYDGSLVEVQYDESTGKARVILEEPYTWAYTSAHDGLSDDTLGYNQNDAHPDWEPFNVRAPYDARGFSALTQLKEGDYYAYLSPGTDDGIAREDSGHPNHGEYKWANAIRYENHQVHGIVWNNGTNSFDNTGKYIGADFDSLRIKGNVSAADAATVFFAEIEKVSMPSSGGETVTHIDIGIIGKSELEFPLAYGRYYDENGKEILEVTPENDVVLELKKEMDVTRDDIMNAGLTAYDKDGNVLDDAYYITGYSANEHTSHSAVQVRMEGSFKVSTLDPYTGEVRANDDTNRRSERLANQVHYEISLTKDVTFNVVRDGQQLYDMHGNALTVTRPMEITVRFGYWDDNNECPVVQDDFEEKYSALFAGQQNFRPGRNNENWKAGAIIDNDYSSYWWAGDYPYYIGDSGMDFVITAVAKSDRNIAIEIKKSIVDPDGNYIHPAGTVKNTFSLYYSKNADKEAVAAVGNGYAVPPNEVSDPGEKQRGYEKLLGGIPIDVGEDGAYIYYNYEIEPGMFYVEEDSGPMAEGGSNYLITDTDGQVWTYKETKVETEYVWRNDNYTGKRHVANGFSGVPEVLGDYEFEGWEEANNQLLPRNGFLEFYVSNVYEKVREMQLVIRKEWKGDEKENRPKSIQVIVSAKDDTSMKPFTVTLSERNNWTYEKTVEPKEYFVREIQVPGYSSSVSSKEDPDGTLVITITNRFVPKTGDGSRPGLWLAILLAGCAGIGTAAAGRRRKRQ